MTDRLAETIQTDVERLCSSGDRDLGTARNRAATDYVLGRLREAGLETAELGFEVPEWRYGGARVRAGGREIGAHPGPFSPALEGSGPLVVIRTADEIGAVDMPRAVLLLCDGIAATQFTPRDYPFYGDPDHAAILADLEAARPLAVLAATSSSAMTGAMCPFPLIEEVGFAAPTAYMTLEDGATLAARAGETVTVSIDSEVRPSVGIQPIGRATGTDAGRIIVSAHIDSKPETPGALDNATGVAVLLAVAELLRDTEPGPTLEFVPFNGEDHVLAPGEMAWLGANEDLSDVRLMINIDAAGLRGSPSAYSLYGVDEAVTAAAADLASGNPHVTEGPQWPASDHMIFAMRGIPAIAVTSTDFAAASRTYSHTPADVPALVDHDLLAGTARFIADLIRRSGTPAGRR
ncbi:MAG: M28 family metallopeptidase [Coriobacteriia bacterium]|nr:M28 family metallopeptidase [Coriobacteriia bacterium]